MSNAPTVIIHGPQGCGKTTNAEKLRRKFFCLGVVDDFGWRRGSALMRGHLHLSNEPLDRLEQIAAGGDVEIVAFDEAMKGIAA